MQRRPVLWLIVLGLFTCTLSSCSLWNKLFGPKYGCPANGRSFGAERVLSGEKPPKTGKFRH